MFSIVSEHISIYVAGLCCCLYHVARWCHLMPLVFHPSSLEENHGGGTTIPPALMYVTTVLVSPISPDTVWKACSPLTPITFCDLGTSCKPLSSMFQMLLGRNSIFHFQTHCTKSSKNISIWTGFAPIARAAEIFWEFFLQRLGFLFKKPCNHSHPAVFLVGEKPFFLVLLANS